jgi:hypothetical protein
MSSALPDIQPRQSGTKARIIRGALLAKALLFQVATLAANNICQRCGYAASVVTQG